MAVKMAAAGDIFGDDQFSSFFPYGILGGTWDGIITVPENVPTDFLPVSTVNVSASIKSKHMQNMDG